MDFIPLIVILLLVARSEGDARSKIIKMTCDNQRENNQTLFIPNFVHTMEIIGAQMRNSHNGSAVTGTGPDSNYGLAQCYGDLSSDDCTLCYAEARTVLPSCYPNNGGRIYLDGCFMRVQNYSFYEEYIGPNDTYVCGNTTRKDRLFGDSVRQAMSNAATDASRSQNYFAREEVVEFGTGNKSVYVLANCWMTLSPSACIACLENASASISKCLPWSEGRALNTGCFMRYSDTNFLNPLLAATSSHSRRGKIIAIVVSIVSSVTVFAVASMIVLYIWKRRYILKKRKGSYDAKKLAKMLHDTSLNFRYSTLEKATGHWDECNKLGQGGFGTVYKGVLSDGREIAVKRLFFNNRFRAADFYNEVNMISSVEHKNLVRLLGCSCSGPESILVYEYLPNMSLDRFIFDATKGKALNWEKRFDIIIGTAEGLVYLHENTKNRIIHRDIKAANILLDLRLRAKIADFGLARSFQDDKSHISTAIAGTLGYMAPEYLAHGQLTEKADVYSFGVLLLEVVTGMENNRSKMVEYTDSLVSIAWNHFQQDTVEEILDPNLMMHFYPNTNFHKEAMKVVQVGLLCTQEAPSLRPSMSMVLKMLAKDDEPLPAPSNPPFIDGKTMELNNITDKLRYYQNGEDSNSVATISHSHFLPRGYMAPKYLAHGQLTEKADVYSFGVLLLEVVTGMENNRSKMVEYTDSLVSIAWNHFQQDTVEEILDPNLMMHFYPNTNFHKEAMKVVQVGLLCTQEAPSLRPSMSMVLKMLAKDDEPLPAPSNPPFIDGKTMELNNITDKLRYYQNGEDSNSVATISHSHFLPR